VTIEFSATFTSGGCSDHITKPGNITVIGGHLTGSGTYTAPSGENGSSCANFDGPDTVSKINVHIVWKTKGGPIAHSLIRYQLNTSTVAGTSTDTITLSAPPGTALKGGSFFTPRRTGPNTTQLITDLPAPASCTDTPVTAFNITGGMVNT
jgi:hypothetical protein